MANAAAQSPLTLRRDAWWVEPAITFVVLTAFVVYTTWRALQGEHYLVEPYLSPFYSPLITLEWWPLSPALLILWAPGGFRFTCYYYRKAYYRSFFWSPPGCAVNTPKSSEYWGESKFPYLLQNLHRYFFYAATFILIFLWYDAVKAFIFEGHFGIGLGSIILTLNAFLLTMYSFSCHSFRHLIGGKLNVFTQCPTRFMIWKKASSMNEYHMNWAWVSLFGVALTDFYVYLLSTGAIQDVRFL